VVFLFFLFKITQLNLIEWLIQESLSRTVPSIRSGVRDQTGLRLTSASEMWKNLQRWVIV
jgi:hypothetical protein